MSLKSEYIGDLEEPAVSSEPRGEFSLFGKVPVAGFFRGFIFIVCWLVHICACHYTGVEVRGQLEGISFLLPPGASGLAVSTFGC